MRKGRKALGCLLVCLFILSGCGRASGPQTIECTTFSVGEEGNVTVYLVGYFGRDYYSLSELMNMVKEETSEYNTAHGGENAVEVSKVELLENDSSRAMILFEYDSAATYSDYNEGSLFYGTVSGAIAAGYTLSAIPLTNVKDGSLATGSYLTQDAAENHILIYDRSVEQPEEKEETSERILIYCPYTVTYLSGGAVLNDDGSVDIGGCEGPCYILMKK